MLTGKYFIFVYVLIISIGDKNSQWASIAYLQCRNMFWDGGIETCVTYKTDTSSFPLD